MDLSWGDLLEDLIEVRNRNYRSDPERNEAKQATLEFIVMTMLEKLRDAEIAAAQSSRNADHD